MVHDSAEDMIMRTEYMFQNYMNAAPGRYGMCVVVKNSENPEYIVWLFNFLISQDHHRYDYQMEYDQEHEEWHYHFTFNIPEDDGLVELLPEMDNMRIC